MRTMRFTTRAPTCMDLHGAARSNGRIELAGQVIKARINNIRKQFSPLLFATIRLLLQCKGSGLAIFWQAGSVLDHPAPALLRIQRMHPPNFLTFTFKFNPNNFN